MKKNKLLILLLVLFFSSCLNEACAIEECLYGGESRYNVENNTTNNITITDEVPNSIILSGEKKTIKRNLGYYTYKDFIKSFMFVDQQSNQINYKFTNHNIVKLIENTDRDCNNYYLYSIKLDNTIFTNLLLGTTNL